MILIPCLWIALGIALVVQDRVSPWFRDQDAIEPELQSRVVQDEPWECPF